MRIATLVAAGVLASIGLPAAAQNSTDFYKDKQISLLVGYAPGGGYDTYARTFARHFPNHIPGKPDIVVKNQPGASSMRVANYLYNSAPRDGREIGAVGRELPTATLMKVKNAKFRSDEMGWLGSLASGATFCIAMNNAPVKTTQDLFEKEFIVGGSNGRSATVVVPLILNNLLGTKIKVIAGYPGGAAMHLAMERGEIQGRCAVTTSSLNASRPDWIKDGKVRFLLEISLADKRSFPDAPLIKELTKSEEDRQKLDVLIATEQWQRPLTAPPGLPADRLALLRRAFDATVADAAYAAEIDRQKLDGGPMGGAEMTKRIKALQATPDAVVQAAIEASQRTDRTAMAEAVVPLETASGKITKVERGGRRVSFASGTKTDKLSVSSSGTKVTIAGKTAKRSTLKEGMACDFAFQGQAAKTIACK